MSKWDKKYLELCKEILEDGVEALGNLGGLVPITTLDATIPLGLSNLTFFSITLLTISA